MKKFAKFFALVAIGLTLATAWVRADSIQDGNAAFTRGDYPAAVNAFQAALSAGGPSAGLYYNLAMAQLKAGSRPEAALSLRRALLLNPRLDDARVSLSEIDRSQGIAPAREDWRALLAQKISLSAIVITGTVLFWLGAFLFLFVLVRGSRGFGAVAGAIFLSLLGGVIAAAGALADPKISDRHTGVIVAPDATTLLSAPADQSSAVTKLLPASAVHILGRSGDWTFCQGPAGERGWLPSSAVEPVVPAA